MTVIRINNNNIALVFPFDKEIINNIMHDAQKEKIIELNNAVIGCIVRVTIFSLFRKNMSKTDPYNKIKSAKETAIILLNTICWLRTPDCINL